MTKRYPTYKGSGVEWIGEIPEHWNVGKLKYGITKNDGGAWGDDFDDNGVIVLRSTEITPDGNWKIEEPARRLLTETEIEKTKLQKGDLLITKSSGSEKHIGKTAVVTEKVESLSACFSNFMQRIRPNQNQDSRYLHYILNSNLAREQYNYLSQTTTGLANLSAEIIGNIQIPFLPSSEQQSIAEYLDRKTRQIDVLIEKKQKQIDLLKEQRTAIINQAVTKGLNPNVKMKDSGIEWLGEIPEHWEVSPLKHAVRINQDSLPEHTDENYGIQYIDIGNVDEDGLLNPPKRMTFGISPSRARRVTKRGDTIVSTVRTYLKAIAYIDSEDENLIASTGFAVLTPTDQIQSKYLYYLVSTPQIIDAISSLSVGVSYPAINSSELGSIPIWFPNSIEEQRDILNSIEREIDGIRDLIRKTEKEIELLREYRTTLISEVVTGKMDVRECSTANHSS